MMDMLEIACAFIAVLIGIVLFIALEDTAHFVFRVVITIFSSYLVFEAMMFIVRQFAY
jgi:hypothetical protein